MSSEQLPRTQAYAIATVMKIGETLMQQLAPIHLSDERLAEVQASDHAYVAANAPDLEWERHVGFAPTSDSYQQITWGIATECGAPPNILAIALVSRQRSKITCDIIWDPPNGRV